MSIPGIVPSFSHAPHGSAWDQLRFCVCRETMPGTVLGKHFGLFGGEYLLWVKHSVWYILINIVVVLRFYSKL